MPVTAVRDKGALRMWVCRLPVHIDPAECTVLYKNLRQIRDFPMGRQSRRPLQRLSLSPVGVDDSVRLRDAPVFMVICGEFATSRRADVGIGPYRVRRRFAAAQRAEQSPAPTKAWANPYYPANFERRAFLPQSFKRNCSQICCPVTGGAYHSARKVSTCVRNTRKSGIT